VGQSIRSARAHWRLRVYEIASNEAGSRAAAE
jgi:hypothetical protein